MSDYYLSAPDPRSSPPDDGQELPFCPLHDCGVEQDGVYLRCPEGERERHSPDAEDDEWPAGCYGSVCVIEEERDHDRP